MDIHNIKNSRRINKITNVLDEALDLLKSHKFNDLQPAILDDIQADMIDECIKLCRKGLKQEFEPIRTIHHLSCTGGTLITKCIAAMPNVMVLNEVDPLSTIDFNAEKPKFSPTDMLSLVRQGNQNVSENLLISLFLQNLQLLRDELGLIGKRLLLRDHSHSHFLRGPRVDKRPTLLSILSKHFETASILTIRDPVDCYLSLKKNGWIHFKPNTFDEYCRRYIVFLEKYKSIRVFRYEDFVDNPYAIMAKMCEELKFFHTEIFINTFDTFKFAGDSGRTGSIINRRPRRNYDASFLKEANLSINYSNLVSKLKYEHL
jgi:hypothetical protein